MTVEQLARLIDLAYDAVAASKVGPIVMGKTEDGNIIFSRFAADTFLHVLGNILPKNVSSEVIHRTDGDDWKAGGDT